MRTTAKPSPWQNRILGCFLVAVFPVLGACRQQESLPNTVAVSQPAEPAAKLAEPPAAPPVDEVAAIAPPADAGPEQPAEPPADEPAAEPEYDPQKVVPLIDHPDQLERLDPSRPVWFDKQNRRVVVGGYICAREVPLEMFACLRGTKEHEAIVAVDAPARVVHAGLVAAGADPGNPVQFYPEYVPARGPEIEVTVVWDDAEGRRQTARAQDWVRNMETKEAMQQSWVFAGSQFTKDDRTGEVYYQADGGDFICVSNFPSAMLDIPIKSSDSNTALMFEGYAERIPPLGTPVTLILTPTSTE